MKIYGQTDALIVREMTENDLEKFLEYMTEHGTNEDFTIDDIRVVWKFRNKKGDIQCTITSPDGKTVYGFCGMLHSDPKAYANAIGFFEKYESEDFKRQIKEILFRMSLEKVFEVLNT